MASSSSPLLAALSSSSLPSPLVLAAGALVLVLMLVLVVQYVREQRGAVPNEPPFVPSWVPVLGSALAFGRDPTNFMHQQRARYGDVFTVNMGGKRMHFLHHAPSYPLVIRNSALQFAPISDMIALTTIGQTARSVGVESFDKEIHAQYARLLNGDALSQLDFSSHRSLRSWIKRDLVRRGGLDVTFTTDLYEYIALVMFEASVDSVFGKLPHDRKELFRLWRTFDNGFPLLVGGMPAMMVKQAIAARDQLIRILSPNDNLPEESSLVRARRALFTDRADIVEPHDVGALQNALLWASVANTMPAAFWLYYHLLANPTAMAAVRAEIEQHLPDTPLTQVPEDFADPSNDENTWTHDQLAQLETLDSCITETLRLTTGSMIVRLAVEQTTLTLTTGESFGVRKGDHVALYPPVLHTDPEAFAEPERFIYDRFLTPEGKYDVKKANKVVPFGGGSTMCPGRFWAKDEIKIFVAMLVRHFDCKPANGAATFTAPKLDLMRAGIGVYLPTGSVPILCAYRS